MRASSATSSEGSTTAFAPCWSDFHTPPGLVTTAPYSGYVGETARTCTRRVPLVRGTTAIDANVVSRAVDLGLPLGRRPEGGAGAGSWLAPLWGGGASRGWPGRRGCAPRGAARGARRYGGRGCPPAHRPTACPAGSRTPGQSPPAPAR